MQHKNIFQRLTMPLDELVKYYRDRRKERFENNEKIHGVSWRKWIHFCIWSLLCISCVLSGQKLTIISDKHKKTKKPVIYACTHVGRYDIEMALQAIRKQCYLFMGDPGAVYKEFDGMMLWINGIIFADTDNKEDRFIGKETCIKALQQKASILIYPEGAWNITSNQVVMPLFRGTAEIAIRSGAEIVPIAIEQYGKQYYANIGESLNPTEYNKDNIQKLTNNLRDCLCTLKWEIWEQFKVEKRELFSSNEKEIFINEIMRQTENGYSIEDIQRTRFHTKEEIAQEEVNTHINNLIPSRANAFLFRKNAKYTI